MAKINITLDKHENLESRSMHEDTKLVPKSINVSGQAGGEIKTKYVKKPNNGTVVYISISKIAGRTSNVLLRAIAASGLVVLCCFFPSDLYAANFNIVASQKIDIDQPSGQCRDIEKFLTSDTNSFCAVTGSGGSFQGGGEFGFITKKGNGWFFEGHSCQPGVFFAATCYQMQ